MRYTERRKCKKHYKYAFLRFNLWPRPVPDSSLLFYSFLLAFRFKFFKMLSVNVYEGWWVLICLLTSFFLPFYYLFPILSQMNRIYRRWYKVHWILQSSDGFFGYEYTHVVGRERMRHTPSGHVHVKFENPLLINWSHLGNKLNYFCVS